jgi:hypothetical protein
LSNPSLFFAIAGISMSFAGFAGLFLALRPRDSAWQRHEIGQINAIVSYALTALFSTLVVVPLAVLVDEPTAIRMVAGLALVAVFYQHQVRAGTSWNRWSQLQRLSLRETVLWRGPFTDVRARGLAGRHRTGGLTSDPFADYVGAVA